VNLILWQLRFPRRDLKFCPVIGPFYFSLDGTARTQMETNDVRSGGILIILCLRVAFLLFPDKECVFGKNASRRPRIRRLGRTSGGCLHSR
jgi:hypothetical protein